MAQKGKLKRNHKRKKIQEKNTQIGNSPGVDGRKNPEAAGRKGRSRHQQKHVGDMDEESDFEEVQESGIGSALKMGCFPGDEDPDSSDQETRKLVQQQNRKKKKSGGFQSMGLSRNVFKGIFKKGYKIPTPIQRKTIPIILDGKDVVAMARTGSGKTAAFLIPMFEKLQVHSAQSGARALILSPTRELALQTLKFTKELGKWTGLRFAVILGGDRMDDQFAALHENPDVIIATPGRFMHILVEMDLKLNAVEYVVFDEADRLFEMGFQEQLKEIIERLPDSRQTLLFSATLPKLLVEFARAGLSDPTLIRLDVDTKLSEQLKLSFIQCRSEDKLSVLLHLLRNVIKPSQQTVVFAATKHHVEYLQAILGEAGLACSYSYSSLDPTARKINVAKFCNKTTMVLLVTDIAARGIDIPMLDNVINFNFPAKPKLFVHRVGRVARAGRSGTAYSLVGPDEISYVLDLHLFLGRPVKYTTPGRTQDEEGLYGGVPQIVIDDEDENLRIWNSQSELDSLKRVADNAYKQYSKSRPAPSAESVKRSKTLTDMDLGIHPLFLSTHSAEVHGERNKFLESMRKYKPSTTVFEMSASKKTQAFEIMKQKRNFHGNIIMANAKKKEESLKVKEDEVIKANPGVSTDLSSDADVQAVFSTVVAPKRPAGDHVFEKKVKKKRTVSMADEANYLLYRPKDDQTEKGLSLGTSFEQQVANAVLDLAGDESKDMRRLNNQMKWDRKRKRYVGETGKEGTKKKIKTESGAWISASYKSNVYKEWLGRSKRDAAEEDSGDEEDGEQRRQIAHKSHGPDAHTGRSRSVAGDERCRNKRKTGGGKGRHHRRQMGIRNKEEILKERRVKAKKQAFQKHQHTKRQKKKAIFSGRRRGKK